MKIPGYCPMGCGQTLFAGAGGHVTCAALKCPYPPAVDEILDDAETEHVVVFKVAAFAILHPIRERLSGSTGLIACDLHQHLQAGSGPPMPPGQYRAVLGTGGWVYEKLAC